MTREEIRSRLEEAAEVLAALPDRDRPRGYRTTWPDYAISTADAYGYREARARRPIPSPEAIDRADKAMRWLQLTDGDTGKLLWARAKRIGWDTLSSWPWAFNGAKAARRYSKRGLTLHQDRGFRDIIKGLNKAA